MPVPFRCNDPVDKLNLKPLLNELWRQKGSHCDSKKHKNIENRLKLDITTPYNLYCNQNINCDMCPEERQILSENIK